MKKCAYCGRENEETARFCTGCGTEFEVPVAPSAPDATKVVGWFKVYTAVLCLCYVVVGVVGLYLLFTDAEERGTAIVMLTCAIPLAPACALPLILKPRPALWTYNFVIIWVGTTSPCFIPATIPLLIAWRKPETKRYFGKD